MSATVTASHITTALELNAQSYTTTLAALTSAASMASPEEAPKYLRAMGCILEHRAPQGDELVRVPMTLRRLRIVRRALRYTVEVALAMGDMLTAPSAVVKLEQVERTCARRANELV